MQQLLRGAAVFEIFALTFLAHAAPSVSGIGACACRCSQRIHVLSVVEAGRVRAALPALHFRNILRSYDRARVWQRYGLFTALMSAGCVSGAASHVVYSRWLAEYHLSERESKPFPPCDIETSNFATSPRCISVTSCAGTGKSGDALAAALSAYARVSLDLCDT